MSNAREPVDLDRIEVLLVDDDERWVDSTARLLEAKDDALVVETALTAARATELVERRNPDCLVCDYALETTTGVDLYDQLEERGRDEPFILVTGQGDEEVASEAISEGVDDYFPKEDIGGRDDALINRIRTVVATDRAQRALRRERRNKSAILDILTTVPHGEGVTEEICTHLVDEQGYACAWVGTLSPDDRLVLWGAAGEEEYVDAIADAEIASSDPPEPGLASLVEREPEVVTVQEGDDDWQFLAEAHGFRSVITVPVTHDRTWLGILAVYSTETTIPAVDRDLFDEYGTAIGAAIWSTRVKESVMSPAPITVEFTFDGESTTLLKIASQLPASAEINVLTTVPQQEGHVLYVLRITEATRAAVEDGIADVDSIVDSTVSSAGDVVRCEVTVPAPTIATVIGDSGGRVVTTTATDDTATTVARPHDDQHVQRLIEAVRGVVSDVEIRIIGTTDTRDVLPPNTTQPLTAKQQRALEMAFYSGYFERPREHNATEVAEKIGVSRQTFTQHLRAGQKKFFATLFDESSP